MALANEIYLITHGGKWMTPGGHWTCVLGQAWFTDSWNEAFYRLTKAGDGAEMATFVRKGE